MSRIGKLPIKILDKVEVNQNGNEIMVNGPLGKLSFVYNENKVLVKIVENEIMVESLSEEFKPFWGTTRSILNNMIIGVTSGYKKSLEINGVGFKFEVSGNNLILSIGYSHKVNMIIPDGLKVVIAEKEKNIIHISGIDKQLVGEYAAKIRSKKKPEPYKGKGIKYVGENIIRKAGKTGSK